jgi:hypothetical protein
MALFNQDLSKYLEKYDSQVANDDSLESLKGLSFYSNWSGALKRATRAQADFNHAIGPPMGLARYTPSKRLQTLGVVHLLKESIT